MCESEYTHMCKYDDICDTIMEYKDHIMSIQLDNPQIKAHNIANFEGCFHTEEDFEKIIDKLPWNAACGPDGITTNLIKRFKFQMSKFLAILYWKSWGAGNFPKALKKAFIIGIHKRGEKYMAKNYWPISLFSIYSKFSKLPSSNIAQLWPLNYQK